MSQSFDRWLRRQAPPVAGEDGAMGALRLRVAERFSRRRRARQRLAAMGVALAGVLVVIGLLDVSPIGSNNRDLVPHKTLPDYLTSPFEGGGYAIRGRGSSSKEFWEAYRELRAAKMRRFVNAGFFEFNDLILWHVGYEYFIDGEWQPVADSPQDESISTMDVTTARAMLGYFAEFAEEIENGTATEVTARRYMIEGRDLWFRVFEKTIPEGILRFGQSVQSAGDIKAE